jgi:hypothetical protein
MKFKNVDTYHTQPVAHDLYACTMVFRGVIPYNANDGYQSCKFVGILLPCLQGRSQILCRLYIVPFSTARPVKEYCLKIDVSFLISSVSPLYHI